MAKQPAPKPAPKPAAAGAPTPYPKTWGQMTAAERQAWMKEHRPGRDPGKPLGPAAPPAPALGVATEEFEKIGGENTGEGGEGPYPGVQEEPGNIVIPASVIGRLTGPAFLAKLFRSLADALDGLTEGDAPAGF